ncbi:MAG: DUF2341 domain-containing protein [Bacteroidetes bacterium]|nr:DUF2341 domain-containing protein [Bacteroidota bacterium]
MQKSMYKNHIKLIQTHTFKALSVLLMTLLLLTGTKTQAQTQVYNIPVSGLVGMGYTACGNGGPYSISNTSIGFDWTDVLPGGASVSSVNIQFRTGVQCAAGSRAWSLNGVSQGNFTTIVNCDCNFTTQNPVSSLNPSVSNYVVGGVNQFRFFTTTNEGFYPNWSGPTYAIVTVNYSTTPCAGTPAPGNTISSLTTACNTQTINLSLQNALTGGGIQYQWERDNGSGYANIGGATSATYSTTQSVATIYRCKVSCSNSGLFAYSNPVAVSFTPCYCNVINYNAYNLNYISNVVIGSISNPSGQAAGYYANYTAQSTASSPGTSNSITVNTIYGGFAVYIDYNNDGDFIDAGENVVPFNNGNSSSFTIPGGTQGTFRMRVKSDYPGYNTGDPCTTYYGEVEDYTIIVGPPCTAPATQASAITFSSIGQNSMAINWTNGDGAGRVVKMNTSNSFTAPADGTNPTANTAYSSGEQVVFNGTGSGSVTITGLNANTTYHFRVYEYCTPNRTYTTATATQNPNSQITAPPCTAPATQASNLGFSSIGLNSMAINWTNGDGAGRVVKMNTSNSFTAPADGTNPSANTAYSGSGEQVVFNGTGSGPVTITGLNPSTTYHFRVYEYCSPNRTYATATAAQNPNSQATSQGQVYNIPLSGLFNMPNQCNSTSYYNNSGIIGVNWTDALPGGATVTGVNIQFRIGVNCSSTGSRSWSLNSVNQGSFTSTSNCSCTPSASNPVLSVNASQSNYIVGGANQFQINAANNEGLEAVAAGPTFVIVTVSYTTGPPCAAPATQASNLSFTSIGLNSMAINWTNGDGAGRVVKMNTANSFTAPADGTNPAANTAYSGSGEQVVFNGTGSGPVTITGLTANTTYHFSVYEYCSPTRTYTTATATGNPNSQITARNWYLDADNDGWAAVQIALTSPGAGWTITVPSGGSGDCNDANAAINPGAAEIPNNGIDENCDGLDLPSPGAGWTQFRDITLNCGTPSANYQVRVQLTAGQYTNMQAQGNDLRFMVGSVLCDYYIETWNASGTSTIWVEVPAAGTNIVRMWYGNSGATAASNGDATFLFFDSFDGSSVNTAKWDVYSGTGSATVSGGVLTLNSGSSDNNGAQIIGKTGFTAAAGFMVESNISSSTSAVCGARSSFCGFTTLSGNSFCGLDNAYCGNYLAWSNGMNGSVQNALVGALGTYGQGGGGYSGLRGVAACNNFTGAYNYGSLYTSNTATQSGTFYPILNIVRFGCHPAGGSQVTIPDVRVRKFLNTYNPTVTVGTANVIATPPSGTPTITAIETSGTANDGQICDGGSLTLTTSATGTYAWSNGSTTQTTASLSPTVNTTYSLTVTSGGCSNAANYTVTVTNCPRTWNGGTTQWNLASNWTPTGVPASTGDAIIPDLANDPVITTSVAAKDITLAPGATLTVAGGGALTLNGTFTNNGATTIQHNGNFLQGNSSSYSGSGSFTVEKTVANGALGYRDISSPVATTVADLADDITIQGQDGVDCWYSYSPYPNVQIYDEAANNNLSTPAGNYYTGWISKTGTGNAMQPMQGFAVRKASGSGAFSSIDFTGTPNNGAYSIGVTKTASATPLQDGWNFTGNPYPSNIDWNIARTIGSNPSTITGIYYVFNTTGEYTGNWGSSNGVTSTGLGGISQYIASGQGFFVEAGTSGTFTLNNSARTATTANFYKSATQANEIRLQLTGMGNTDEIVAYTDAAATWDKDNGLDAVKIPAGSTVYMSYKQLNQEYAINVIDEITETTELPLVLWAQDTGTYTFEATELNVDGYITYLKDAELNTLTDLTTTSSVTMQLNGQQTYEGRYSIVFEAVELPSSIANINEGKTKIYSHSNIAVVERNNDQPATITISNTLGQTIKEVTTDSKRTEITLDNANAWYAIVKVKEANATQTGKVLIQ